MCFRRVLFSKVDRTFQTQSILLSQTFLRFTPQIDEQIMQSLLACACCLSAARLCVSRRENTYSKLFLELGVVVGAQILDMLQERLLVDRPDGREEEHLEAERTSPSNVTICYFLRAYFSPKHLLITSAASAGMVPVLQTYLSDFL